MNIPPLTEPERIALRIAHVSRDTTTPMLCDAASCRLTDEPWPCPVIRLVVERDRLAEDVTDLRAQVTRYEQRAYDLSAELERARDEATE